MKSVEGISDATTPRASANTIASSHGPAEAHSGVLLVGGIMSVAFFAFLNAPFKGAENNTSITSREVAAPVTDKKGLEYIPEPVSRPPSSAPSPSLQVPPPVEKR